MSLISGSSVTGAGSVAAYQIERSLRFNSADSAYLSRTFSAASTNVDKQTVSFWFKRSQLTNTSDTVLNNSLITQFGSGGNYPTYELGFEPSSDQLVFMNRSASATYNYRLVTTQQFRDPSAWYHLVIAYDSSLATSTDRIKMWINGTQITAFSTATYPAQNLDSQLANNAFSQPTDIGGFAGSRYFTGYMTEINFIDGQALTPSDFGETDTNTGVWKPKAFSGTYGTNGFYLKFADNSNTTAATLGKDSSGNGNNWTPNNFSVTAGAGNDSLVDSPTSYGTDTGVGGEVRGNYATLNPLAPSSYVTISNGNLTATGNTSTNSGMAVATIGVATGKIVWEETITTVSGNFPGVGATTVILQDGNGQNPAASNTQGVYYRANGTVYKNSASLVGTYATFSNGDVVRFELDADALTCAIYKNNTLIVTVTGLTAGTFYPSNVNYNSSVTNSNFGQRPFANTANSGFKALCTQNLPTPTIGATSTTQANDYFNAVLWTGANTSAGNSVTGVGFSPDFVWAKIRSQGYANLLYDRLRGTGGTAELSSNETSAEGGTTASERGYLNSFDSDGFSSVVGTNGDNLYFNQTSQTYVAWNWKANGAGSSNTAGTITSTVSANTTSGFSIVTYTGNVTSGATVGHGLGVAPSMVIIKWRTGGSTQPWVVYHISTGNSAFCTLNTTNASSSLGGVGVLNNTTPGSSVITLGDYSGTNGSGTTYVAYCFAPVAGYSAFGSFTGNGSNDGPFVYTGFRPRYVMIKISSSTGSWVVYDSVRATYNVMDKELYPNISDAEGANAFLEFTSNGFKVRSGAATWNANNSTNIYACFAESPFKYSLAR